MNKLLKLGGRVAEEQGGYSLLFVPGNWVIFVGASVPVNVRVLWTYTVPKVKRSLLLRGQSRGW